MDQYGSSGSLNIEIVVVVAGDAEVPHPAVMDGRDRAFDHNRSLAAGGLEALARPQVTRR
jgi:hypothetical protein